MAIRLQIDLGRNYSAQELRSLYGDDWKKLLGLASPPVNKPIITDFGNMDAETSTIYLRIYKEVLELNRNHTFNVYATGSRIKGYWRTKAEALSLSVEYNRPLKESDYDYWTDAINKPTKSYLDDILGVQTDFNRDYRRVLVKTHICER